MYLRRILQSKKASLETKEILELILAAAGIFILIVLLYQLLAPGFDPNKEAAKSYLASFKKIIGEVDKAGSAQFSLLAGAGEVKMVYFDAGRPAVENKFFRSTRDNNYLCFCYKKGEDWKCSYCVSLKYPAQFSEEDFVYKPGQGFKINLSENSYFFEVVK